ncbi:HNH endonuclease signature motif containing protein [Amnibacterium endophyticum]|uniref:DUF222 domain-containing protein n=1 Tax=Amnibacterium endophyticum TaxID=2109337 RepID=A0ABW4LF63_9MICO
MEIVPLRLPRQGERVLAERRRRLTFGPHFLDWMLETVLVRPREAAGEGVHDTLAALRDESRRVWVLEQLYAQRIDPASVQVRIGLTDECDVDPDEWQRLPIAPESAPEPDPVLAALEVVTDLQQQLQRDESRRVVAALAAWRTALAEEGEPTAANTPYQRGFFTDLALRLRVASTTARTLVHTGSDLEAALPRVWGLFVHGGTTWRVMQTVHAELDGLDPSLHAEFDEQALAKILHVAPTGLPDALRRLRERLQASTADDRHERAAARRHVRLDPAADGMAWLHAYLPAADAIALDHQLSRAAVHAAGREGESRGVGQLRADALVDGLRQALRRPRKAAGALVPGRRGVEPQVLVTIPAMTALGHSTAPALLEGYGVIGTGTALRLAADAKSWVRVLTDPFTGAALALGRARYRPSKDLRLWLRMADGATRGPTAPRSPGEAEVDHVVPFHQDGAGGRTDPDNLVLLTRREHRDKTEGAGDYRLLADRTGLWRTATGTTIVTRPVEPPDPTPVPPHLVDPDDCPF